VRIAILLILFSSVAVRAFGAEKITSSYYVNMTKKLKDHTFRRLIMPQLKAMKTEYYLLIKKIEPASESSIKLKDLVKKALILDRDRKNICSPYDIDKCPEITKELYNQLRKIDLLLLKMLSVKFDKLDEKKLRMHVALHEQLDQIAGLNYSMLHLIEKYIILDQTHFHPSTPHDKIFNRNLYQLNVLTDNIITELLPKKYKSTFQQVYSLFFQPIERYGLAEKDSVWYLRRLEELNLSWNTFHMKITKDTDNVPKSLLNVVRIMHNRWNSTLKVVLRK
jgi:hypothetical protein